MTGSIRIDRRVDGTISSVWEEVTETATLPSGREVSETRWDQVSIDALDALLGSSYVQFDAHNRALEQQIIAERAAAEAALASALQQRDTVITGLLAQLEALRAPQ